MDPECVLILPLALYFDIDIVEKTDEFLMVMQFTNGEFYPSAVIKTLRYLFEQHGNKYNYFFVSPIEEYIRQTEELTMTAKALIFLAMGAIFIIILGFGGILVSITNSRVHEIGICLCVGVKLKKIAFEIMFEAVIISFIGGILGRCLSIPLIKVLKFDWFQLVTSWRINIILLLFSCMIGLVASIVPLRRLRKLMPLEIIR